MGGEGLSVTHMWSTVHETVRDHLFPSDVTQAYLESVMTFSRPEVVLSTDKSSLKSREGRGFGTNQRPVRVQYLSDTEVRDGE